MSEEKKDEKKETGSDVKKLDENSSDTGNPAATYPDVETIKKVIPVNESDIRQYAPYLLNTMGKNGLTSKNQLVGMLATAYVEVGGIKPVREFGKGGGSHGQYYGRGVIQLTHKGNYKVAQEKFGKPYLSQPDIALDPQNSADVTCAFWKGELKNVAVAPYAEKADWKNVRSTVNAGHAGSWAKCHGKEKFMGAIERGLKYFRSGIQGNFPMGGSYGLGCVDSGSSMDLTGSGNPGSMGDALAYALGVFNALNAYSHRLNATFNASGFPDILKLEAQSKFNVVNFGADLDGEYFVDEITFYGPHTGDLKGAWGGKGLEVEMVANRPNPNAPTPNIFSHNSNSPLVDPGNNNPNITATDVSGRIYQAGTGNKGKTTADSPPACQGGKLACAYAVNKFCIIPAGLPPMGSGSSVGSLAVAGILAALAGGRGQKVPLDQVVPGDIWADARGNRHIGIFIDQGGKNVLSNSSSKARFSWVGTIGQMSSYYGGGQGDNFWRVLK